MFRKFGFLLAVVGLMGGGYQSANAQQSGLAVEVPGINNFAGLVLGFAPDYFGSDEYTLGIAPVLKLQLGRGKRYFRLLATEASLNVLNSRSWSFGPLINYRVGRSDIDDAVVSKMKDIEGTVEAGLFLGWQYVNETEMRNRLTVSLDVLYDVGGEHEGYLISAKARYWRPMGRALTWSIGVGGTYASDDYSSTYFGVNASNVGTSGLPFYSPGGGMRDINISPTLVLSLSRKLHLVGGIMISKLLGDVADSPVVDIRGSDIRIVGGFGFIYAW